MSGGTKRRYAIVGGGILGMTLALRLLQRGHDVTLFERANEVGGLANAWSLDGIVWDRHYHVTLLSDSYWREILREIGLEEDFEWVETKTGFFSGDALHSMSDSLEFLRFPPIGLISKARLAATILYASRITDWRRLEQVPVADWLKRWSGSTTFDRIWLPLLRSKLGESYRDTSAAFIWATIRRMYAARRSGLKREMFGYVRGGYGRILQQFRAHLEMIGLDLRLGAEVRSVTSTDHGGVVIQLTDGSRSAFHHAILTVPCPAVSRLCPGLERSEKDRLDSIRYQGIVCASLLLKKPLAGFYITNITDSWVPFTAVIEMSALVNRRELGGHTLVYLPRYLDSNDQAFDTPDNEWRSSFVDALIRMYPHIEISDVICFKVSRERFVYALPTIGYSRTLPSRQTSLPGVSIVNSAQIVNGTLNVNETVRLAEESIPDILGAGIRRESSTETVGS